MKKVALIFYLLFFILFSFAQTNHFNEDITEKTAPVFPGGDDSLAAFIKKNLNYPYLAIQKKLQGKIYILFIINEDGKISNAAIHKSTFTVNKKNKTDLKKAETLIELEALRIVNNIPYWKPGKINGEAVKIKYILPVTFSLKN